MALPSAEWPYVASRTRELAVRERVAREVNAAAVALAIRVAVIVALIAAFIAAIAIAC